MGALSALLLPGVVAMAGGFLLFGKKDYFSAFVEGAREGLTTCVRLLPPLCALLVGVAMLEASGLTAYLASWLSPLLARWGVPAELLPLLIVRPLSGGAATASLAALLPSVGADSLAGLCASVIYGSTDTLLYVLGVYSSAAGFRSARGALLLALLILLFCILFSCFLCRLCFF